MEGATEISVHRVPPGVIFRCADEKDIPELLRIEDECFGKEKFSQEIVRAFIVRNDAFTVVAQDDLRSRLVGSATCLVSEGTGEGRIASIAVLRHLREQGIGSGLLAECEKTLGNYRLAKYVLEVETTNIPAIALYLHRGYEITGLLKEYYGLGRDAYTMEKKLVRIRRKLAVMTE